MAMIGTFSTVTGAIGAGPPPKAAADARAGRSSRQQARGHVTAILARPRSSAPPNERKAARVETNTATTMQSRCRNSLPGPFAARPYRDIFVLSERLHCRPSDLAV